MIKFNDNNIIVGHIKQVLSSFNLPKYEVYTNDTELINNTYYIKNNEVQLYKDTRFIPVWPYEYNEKKLNYTKNLVIKNNIYDRYTHNYLGEYLRFLRDYKKLDLMPLYNCFDNTIANNLDIVFTNDKSGKIKFNSKDTAYKIYMIPVKAFQQYTLGIDCPGVLEMCYGFYGEYQFNGTDTSTTNWLEKLYDKTYLKLWDLKFNNQILINKLYNFMHQKTFTEEEKELRRLILENRHDLKLFIKVPATIKSTIAVLEGNYVNWNDAILNSKTLVLTKKDSYYVVEQQDKFIKQNNHFITNFEGPVKEQTHTEGEKYNDHIGYQEDQLFNPISALQLLAINTKESYPFADRLIEYITDNVITNDDEISDDIKRVQKIIKTKINCNESYFIPGLWTNKIRHIVYDYVNIQSVQQFELSKIRHDSLGYIDKDIEKYYQYIIRDPKTDKIVKQETILNADIYEEEE